MNWHNPATYQNLTPDALDRLKALPLCIMDGKAIDFLFVTLENIRENMTDDPAHALEAFNESLLWLMDENQQLKEELLKELNDAE